ncbi:MAG: hypothetical protein E7009_04445 [Alphaproteobacteria bacterium]|nr:hypothetical protein [Alphaproteobacteria bacterium]
MKKIGFLFICVPFVASAATPSTECPAGYISVNAPAISVATTCPSDTVSAGTANSCLTSNPAANCIMYAPAGVSYTDVSGTYEFSDACAM